MVKTARIAIAWDFRRSPGACAIPLAGIRHSVVGWRAARALSVQEVTESRTDVYQITSDDKLVGEIGFVSSNGWRLSEEAESKALVWPWEPSFRPENCSADGIGGELKTDAPK
jgi:hypothetical protein